MKRAVVVVACCLALSGLRPALADSASDRDMANRYEQSAQAGDDDAQFYLGALHSAGVGRPRSDQEAFRWFSRATDQGHAHAMLIVAGLYAIGRGTTKDNVKAYSWAYIVASASKVDEYRYGARQLKSLLKKKMTSDEIGRAVVAAKAWRAVRVAGADKASYIEREVELDQATPTAPPLAPAAAPETATPAAPSPAPAEQAAAAAAAPVPAAPAPATTSRSEPSTATAAVAPADTAAPAALDQVPHGLRKRAAPDAAKPADGQAPVQAATDSKSGVRQKQGRRGKPAAEEPPKAEQATPGDAAKEDASRDAAAAETAATDPAKADAIKGEGEKPARAAAKPVVVSDPPSRAGFWLSISEPNPLRPDPVPDRRAASRCRFRPGRPSRHRLLCRFAFATRPITRSHITAPRGSW